MQAATMKIVNGVNVDRLAGTIEAVQQNPALADFTFRSANRWIAGGHNRSTIKDFRGVCQEDTSRKSPFILDNDEPDILLGTDNGANPVEYILHALAGCITTTSVYHAAAKGIKIADMESSYEGYLDLHGFLGLKHVPRGYQHLKIRFKIGGDLTQEQKEEIIKTGCRYSPVYDMMKKAIPEIGIEVS